MTWWQWPGDDDDDLVTAYIDGWNDRRAWRRRWWTDRTGEHFCCLSFLPSRYNDVTMTVHDVHLFPFSTYVQQKAAAEDDVHAYIFYLIDLSRGARCAYTCCLSSFSLFYLYMHMALCTILENIWAAIFKYTWVHDARDNVDRPLIKWCRLRGATIRHADHVLLKGVTSTTPLAKTRFFMYGGHHSVVPMDELSLEPTPFREVAHWLRYVPDSAMFCDLFYNRLFSCSSISEYDNTCDFQGFMDSEKSERRRGEGMQEKKEALTVRSPMKEGTSST